MYGNFWFWVTVLARMERLGYVEVLRKLSDQIERCVPTHLWPLTSYREPLFIN